jgi:hypothetical protein
MNTIAPHLTVATVLAVRHLSYVQSLAAARTGAQAAGAMGLTFVILIVAFLAVMAWAARGLAVLITGFLRVAASMTSVLFAMLIAVVVAVALLAHH